MSLTLWLVYAEYDSGDPPFIWSDGERRGPEERQSAMRLISEHSRLGKNRYGEWGLAVWDKNLVLIQTADGLRHEDGGPQGAVVLAAVDEVLGAAGLTEDLGEAVTDVLRDARITVDPVAFGAVVRWAFEGHGAGPGGRADPGSSGHKGRWPKSWTFLRSWPKG